MRVSRHSLGFVSNAAQAFVLTGDIASQMMLTPTAYTAELGTTGQ